MFGKYSRFCAKFMNINNSHQSSFRAIFGQAVQSVDGRHCVSDYLRENALSEQISVLAIGKAACHMAQGACDVYSDRIVDGLIITRHGYVDIVMPKIMQVLEAGHPVPDSDSLTAGQALLAFMQRVTMDSELLVLISGGASSLVEVLSEDVTLNQLQKLNEWLLRSGLPITEMNAIRQQVSCIKGGGLCNYLQGHRTTVLLISDVEQDDPTVIGSGLLFPSNHLPHLPKDVSIPVEFENLLDKVKQPKIQRSANKLIKWKIIANIHKAQAEARLIAESLGYRCKVYPEYLRGDAIVVGRQLAASIQSQPGVLHIWGGETTVSLPTSPGIGGRCHSLALSAAIELQRMQQSHPKSNWSLLAAGTDGKDGVCEAAGVCIGKTSFENTVNRLENAVRPQDFLNRADAGSFFALGNNQVLTGPTGTNVNDIILGYWEN